jgi:hypothetical protein
LDREKRRQRMESKKCRYCKEDIQKDAKKCPVCKSWQGKYVPDLQSPRGFVYIMVVMFFIYGIVFGGVYATKSYFEDSETVYPKASDALSIKSSEVVHYDCREAKCVAVIGVIENKADYSWKKPYIHAEFFNADGSLINTMYDLDYDLLVPANSSTSFKISEITIADQLSYDSYKIVIKDALLTL